MVSKDITSGLSRDPSEDLSTSISYEPPTTEVGDLIPPRKLHVSAPSVRFQQEVRKGGRLTAVPSASISPSSYFPPGSAVSFA